MPRLPARWRYRDYRLAVISCRLNVLNVVNQCGDRLLEWSREPPFYFFRIQTGVLPGNRHNRNVDVWEDIGWRTQDHERTQDQNEQRQDDERVRPIQGQFNDPHGS